MNQELKEKTAKIMGWSRIKLNPTIEEKALANEPYIMAWSDLYMQTIMLISEWNPLENIEHFFMVIDKLDLTVNRDPNAIEELRYQCHANAKMRQHWSVFSPALKELMPSVIKKICEVE